MRRWIGAILLLVVVGGLSGCFLFPGSGGAQSQLLYSEDFSNPDDSGWYQGEDPGWEWAITGGRYYGWVIDEDSLDYVYDGSASGLTDGRFQAKTGQLGAATDHSWGLIFRAAGQSFYAFEISADGYVLFAVHTATGWDHLYGWEPCPAIRSAGETNEIRVDADGSSFSLYVNGQFITEVTDTRLSSGSVGFIIETWVDAEGGVWFDDLEVWSLGEEGGGSGGILPI